MFQGTFYACIICSEGSLLLALQYTTFGMASVPALKAYNEKYVEYILTGNGRLLADAPWIRGWETFVFVHPPRTT